MNKVASPSVSKRVILTLAVAAVVSPVSVETQAAALEEVIVTAQKREESSQEVPISIVAIGAEQLEARGIQNSEDLIGQIPALGRRISILEYDQRWVWIFVVRARYILIKRDRPG